MKLIYSFMAFVFVVMLISTSAEANIHKNHPRSAISPGWIGATGLRLYVDRKYQYLCKMLSSRKVTQAIPLLESEYKRNPKSEDLYVALAQSSPIFRKNENQKFENQAVSDTSTVFRRGVIRWYQAQDLAPVISGEKRVDLLKEAIRDLEHVWSKQPSIIRGAVLMDAYDWSDRKKALGFTEEFLKFADGGYTYHAYARAKSIGFTSGSFDPNEISEGKSLYVAGILSERWSLLGYKNKGLEAEMLNRWWRSISVSQ